MDRLSTQPICIPVPDIIQWPTSPGNTVSMEDVSATRPADCDGSTAAAVAHSGESLLESFHQQGRSQSDGLARLEQRRRDKRLQRAVTLADEVHAKYNTEQGMFAQNTQIFVKPLCSPNKQGLMPGKRNASGALEMMVLNGRQISAAGLLQPLQSHIGNITDLDLAQNSLSDWKEVSSILRCMPHVRHCNLSHNPLCAAAPVEWETEAGRLPLARLTSLVLNATGLRWDALFSLLNMCPNLSELHLSLNRYQKAADMPSGEHAAVGDGRFGHIRVLHVNKCRLPDWRSLCLVCAPFPRLEVLVAAENPISTFGADEHDECGQSTSSYADYFGSLQSLNINRWLVSHWDQVDRIRHFPALHELRMSKDMPLFLEHSDEERWNLIVARLPQLAVLNGSLVTEQLRVDAERFFIRYYMGAQSRPERYAALESVHGHLEPLAEIDLRPRTHATVRFVCDEPPLDYTASICLDQTVGQLRRALQHMTGVPAGQCKLMYVDSESPQGPDELKLPSVKLHSLARGVQDGDRFIIIKKPASAGSGTSARRNTAAAASSTSASAAPSSSGGKSVRPPSNRAMRLRVATARQRRRSEQDLVRCT